MSIQEQACYTFEAAIEMAVRMEDEGFRSYLQAMRKVKDRGAKEVLKDAALDELDHKHQLERALLEGQMNAHMMEQPVATMNLDYVLRTSELTRDADVRQALAYSIHLEKQSLEFYDKMQTGCAGAPMAALFQKIYNDETRHLQILEDLYEKHFLPEN